MTFSLSEADLDKDFDELIVCQNAAHENPVQSFYYLFCPIQDKSTREAAVKESTARMLDWHRHEPNARWLKVVDTKTGKIVGGAWYKIYNENPFAYPEDEVVDWYPDDSSRDFVGQAIFQMDIPRMQKATRPQVFLNILFSHPDYRRKGIGAMLLQWGIDAAKRLGVEFWLNSTPPGKPLYEKFGFQLVQRNPLVPKTDKPDAKWKQMEEEFGEMVFWTMWLPKDNANEDEETIKS